MKTLIIDTCYWIALFNPEREPQHQEIVELIEEQIDKHTILIPYPTLYEFLDTKFSRKDRLKHFYNLLSKPNFIKIDDSKYKEKALDNFFIKSTKKTEDVSFVDEIIKEMIDDENLKTDFIITFDKALENYAYSKNVKSI
jgi:predicted nucleic acid-binding protein